MVDHVDTVNDQAVVDRWRELAARRVHIWSALEQVLEQRHGLSCHEFEVMDQLAECAPDMKPRVQDLADVVPITQSALSRLIARLEKQGLILRTLCEEDRRGINVRLTDAGRARHAEARPTYCAVLSQQFTACEAAEAAGRKLGLGEIVGARHNNDREQLGGTA